MTAHVFDTSSLVKLYHAEPGTAAIEAIVAAAKPRPVISRLTVVEMFSAYAKMVRMGRLSPPAYRLFARRFRGDLRAKRFEVVRPLVRHHDTAAQLIDRHGLTHNLRTQDAIQLAVALDLRRPDRAITLITSDAVLVQLARLEGLLVVNPDPA